MGTGMIDSIQLRTLEKKAFLSTYQDGFWEIWFGLFLIGSSISSCFPDNDLVRILNTLVVALAIPSLVFWLGKKYVTLPRLGIVKFGKIRQAKRKKIGIFILFLNFPVFLLWLLSSSGQLPAGLKNWLNTYYGSPAVFAFMVLVFFVAGAAITGLRRLYLYGLLLAASMFLFELSYIYDKPLLNHFLPYFIAGIIMTGIGLCLLFRFIKKYPLPAPGESNDSG
jgi:hypothetical protein